MANIQFTRADGLDPLHKRGTSTYVTKGTDVLANVLVQVPSDTKLTPSSPASSTPVFQQLVNTYKLTSYMNQPDIDKLSSSLPGYDILNVSPLDVIQMCLLADLAAQSYSATPTIKEIY